MVVSMGGAREHQAIALYMLVILEAMGGHPLRQEAFGSLTRRF